MHIAPLAFAGVAAGIAVAAYPGTAAADRIWLPHVAAPPVPEVCAPAAPGPWEVRCGGFGRIRDLRALADGTALAVGDGVAHFTGDTWRPQLGGGLHGLEAVTVAEGSGRPGMIRGWAVGEADLIAQLIDGRWSPDAPGERDPAVVLHAVSSEGETWAAGSRGSEAVLRWLRVDAGEEGRWHDVPDQANRLPPIADLIAIVDGFGRPAGWAVGSAAAGQEPRPPPTTGAFVRYDGRWAESQRSVGEPQELLLTGHDAGWAFGGFPSEPEVSLAFWRLTPLSAGTWIEEPSLRLPGRRLIDTYQRPENRPDRVVVAVEPTHAEEPVLFVYWSDDDVWRPTGPALPAPVGGAKMDIEAERGANRAVAPLADDGLLYAWGDNVWALDAAADEWSLARRRRRLGALAAGWSASLALDSQGAALVASSTSWTAPVVPPVPPDGRWQLLDGTNSFAWALAYDGTALTLRGPLGRWNVWAPPNRPQRVTAIRADGAEVLAAGRSGGAFALWRGDGADWRRIQVTGAAAPVTATLAAMEGRSLAAWPNGWMWAAGVADSAAETAAAGAVIALPPECRDAGCRARAYAFGVPVTAIAATGPDEAWAAGRHVLIRCDAEGCRQQSPSPAPFGAHFVTLAAASATDVWAVLHEGDPERPSSLLLHFDGARWAQTCRTDVALSDAAVVRGPGGTTLWLSGDWNTVIRHEYRSSAEAELPCHPR